MLVANLSRGSLLCKLLAPGGLARAREAALASTWLQRWGCGVIHAFQNDKNKKHHFASAAWLQDGGRQAGSR